MAVDVRCETTRARSYRAAAGADAGVLLALLGLEECELSLSLVSDREIQRLNRDYRGKDAATDVLSFPLLDGTAATALLRRVRRGPKDNQASASPIALGDLVISIDTTIRQARALRISPVKRLRTLLIHGLLHLLGYDHEKSAAAARRMFARERKVALRLETASSNDPHGATPRQADPGWPPAAMPEPRTRTKRRQQRRSRGTMPANHRKAKATGQVTRMRGAIAR